VTIERIEHEIIERAYAEGWVEARPPAQESGRHVAVVGSGPAGLAAAQELRRAGHRVTVYDADDAPGGMLRYGIPDFKMEKWPLERRLTQLEAEGIEFRCGVTVGDAVGWAELRAGHDALLIAVGARRARELDVPGRELGGVVMAMDYLYAQNRVVAGQMSAPPPGLDAAGKRVVILGGGDTGSDCHGTALRQKATQVSQIQLWPAPPPERAEHNPWPEWPVIFRTSSSQEEGGERDFALQTRSFIGEGGVVRAVEAVRIDMQLDPAGRKRPVPRPGSETAIPADMVILAIGFSGPELGGAAAELGVELDRRGNIAVGPDFATRAEGVFCAGDAMRGASLIVWAIADGRRAARSIDAYLAARSA
jgi:glutamate synthase (NADPH/NADH) small chain